MPTGKPMTAGMDRQSNTVARATIVAETSQIGKSVSR